MGRYSGEKWGGGGVSRGLGVTFIKGIVVKEGEGEDNDVLVECEVVGALGKRNVVLRGESSCGFLLCLGGLRDCWTDPLCFYSISANHLISISTPSLFRI